MYEIVPNFFHSDKLNARNKYMVDSSDENGIIQSMTHNYTFTHENREYVTKGIKSSNNSVIV